MPKLSEVAHLGKAVIDSLHRGAPDIEMVGADRRLDGENPACTIRPVDRTEDADKTHRTLYPGCWTSPPRDSQTT